MAIGSRRRTKSFSGIDELRRITGDMSLGASVLGPLAINWCRERNAWWGRYSLNECAAKDADSLEPM